jgi:NADH-quinone oxidoreductase subunit J
MLVAALLLLLPNGREIGLGRRSIGILLGLAGLTVLWSFIPKMSLAPQTGFSLMASVSVGFAVATITSRSPVYCAIWFAVSLLGTAGLFLFGGAQFIGVATVAVYAGAIVVTFLFVLMLAQPEGLAFFDRISWGAVPKVAASAAAVGFALVIASLLSDVDEEEYVELRESLQAVLSKVDPSVELRNVRLNQRSAGELHLQLQVAANLESRSDVMAKTDALEEAAAALLETTPSVSIHWSAVLATNHVAHFGGTLFSRHLIAVQVVAILLLVALVGAIAIANRDQESVGGTPQ